MFPYGFVPGRSPDRLVLCYYLHIVWLFPGLESRRSSERTDSGFNSLIRQHNREN
jgi:hypothetical protein